jgi:hypothetical protein
MQVGPNEAPQYLLYSLSPPSGYSSQHNTLQYNDVQKWGHYNIFLHSSRAHCGKSGTIPEKRIWVGKPQKHSTVGWIKLI